MTDAVIGWDNEAGEGDLCLLGADIQGDEGLHTAVLVSLFTDRRVAREELPAGDTGRRGWWGDALSQDDDEIGSKLWLLGRRKQDASLPSEAAAWAREALQWMLDDETATDVETGAEWARRGELRLRVRITLPDTSLREFQFEDLLRAA